MGRYDDKVVLLAGGGSGLGRGLIDCFVAEGAKVGTFEIADDKVQKLEADFDRDQVLVIQGDVRRPEDNQRAVAEVVSHFGRLDAFVQCAAITDYAPKMTDLPYEQLPKIFDEILSVNVLGSILGVRAALPELQKTNGSIVLTLSSSGFTTGSQGAIYTVSMHALVGVVKQLALELAPTVRVNAVVPGAIKESRIGGPVSLGQEDLYPEKLFADAESVLKGTVPLQLYPSAVDYGPVYLLLAGPESKLMTGAIVHADTGMSLIGYYSSFFRAHDAP